MKKISSLILGLTFLMLSIVPAFGQTPDEKVRKFKTRHTKPVFSVSFSPDGKTLASASADKRIKLWNVASGKELKTLAGHSDTVSSIAFSPDGKTLVSGSWDKTIKLWNVASGKALKIFRGHSDSVSSIAFSPDEKTLVSGSFDKTVRLWDVASGKELNIFRGHSELVSSIAFSPDGKTLVSGSDKTVRLWDVASGKELNIFSGHSASVDLLAFSSDGKAVAFGSDGGTVRLWDFASGKELKTFSGHSESVDSLAFSSDGKTLASGSNQLLDRGAGAWDLTIKLWDVASGEQLKTLSDTSSPVTSLALSSNGKTLILGSEDGTIKSWNTSARSVQTAQSVAGKWKLEAMLVESDMAYPINAPVTLILSETGEISGNGGCHDFVGKYSFKQPEGPFETPQQISFSEIKPLDRGATKDCQRESITEQAFFSSLKSAATVVFEDGLLVIQNKPTFINTEKRKIVIQNTMAFVRDKL